MPDYIPILKAKQGEFLALSKLGAAKHRVTPLMELVPVPFDYGKEEPSTTLEAHALKVPNSIKRNWGTQEIWVDAGGLGGDEFRALQVVLSASRSLNVSVVPVVRVQSSAQTKELVKEAMREDGRGVVIRLCGEALGSGRELAKVVRDLVVAVDGRTQDAHLVVDLGPVPQDSTLQSMAASLILGLLPGVSNWRSLILSSGAFPTNLSGFKSSSTERVRRSDFELWQRVAGSGVSRLPTFGDYAIGHPDWTEMDYRKVTMSANIRYTGEDSWVIVKGVSLKKKVMGQQMEGLCQKLMEEPEFSRLSWGDEFITECAYGSGKPGNATTWRAVGTNRHIMKVLEQLSTRPG